MNSRQAQALDRHITGNWGEDMNDTRNWSETREEVLERELAQLKAAVRELSDNRELLHMVGPSDEEQEAAEQRMAKLDRLEAVCHWDSMSPDYNARMARAAWRAIMDTQGEFESRYC